MFTQESSFQENQVALSKLSKEQCVHFSVHLAKYVLHVWEERFPDDDRPRKAIEAAEHWLIDQNTNAAANAANARAAAYAAASDAWAAARAAAARAAWVAADAAYAAADAAYAAGSAADRAAAYAARAAADAASDAASAAADAARATPDAARATPDAAAVGKNWEWISKLYSSIYKEQPFPQNWKTRDTISIAKDMLTSRNLKDMPILADALEDAGCTDAEILYHLRNDEGLWCLGDWVLTNLGE